MGIDGFEVTKSVDVYTPLVKYRNNYNDKGKYLGFENFDEYYSMSLGNCTDWTGFPMSGKTQVLMECLVNTSKFYGWKHLIYFPDVGSNIEIIADLINKFTGKSFNPLSTNPITDNEIATANEWVNHHFFILTKVDVKAKMTPVQFWDFAVHLKKSNELHTASIDSWKDLSHNYNDFGGYAQYLEFVLPYRNQIAEDNNLHLHTIIHPKLTEKENGKRNAPVPYDLKGGSEWFNSGKCMITVHRSNLETNQVEIHVNKIKPRSNGKIGIAMLNFDLRTLTYYNLEHSANGLIKHYASERNEVKHQYIETSLMPNEDFDNTMPF